MTTSQRNKINKIYSEIQGFIATLEDIKDNIQDKYHAMSEKQQDSETGEKLQEEISLLEDAISGFESANENLDNAKAELC